jgi:nitroreductase
MIALTELVSGNNGYKYSYNRIFNDFLKKQRGITVKGINELIQTQIAHRTIREFKDKKIPDEVFELLMEVARRTATSTGMQACSIIRVTDQEIKNKIAGVCSQEYVARAPELLIFIVDQYRNNQIAKEKGYFAETAKDMDRFF